MLKHRAQEPSPPIPMWDALSRNLPRESELTPDERLEFHQKYGGPVVNSLKDWMDRQFAERLVEPNSGLGAAIEYLRKHWTRRVGRPFRAVQNVAASTRSRVTRLRRCHAKARSRKGE